MNRPLFHMPFPVLMHAGITDNRPTLNIFHRSVRRPARL